MANKKTIFATLIISIFNIVLLTVGHYYSISWLVLATLVGSCIIAVLADIRLIFPLLLFNLAWIPLLRPSIDSSFSFWTIITIISLIRLSFKIKKNVNILPFIILATFAVFEFIVRFARMVPIKNDLLHIVVLLIILTLLLVDRKNYSNFKVCTVYFAIGLLLSCFASYLVVYSPNMQELIKFEVTVVGSITIFRQSGLTGDPNFFASQIIMAIVCLMTLFRDMESYLYMISNYFLIGAFLYFGFASVSKMFLFSIFIIGVIWLIGIISSKKRSHNIGVLFMAILLIVIISNSQLFLNSISDFVIRLSDTTDLRALTSGRNNLQLIYIDYILSNLDVLICGKGFTFEILQRAGNDMHNTFIELIYEAGILGTFLLGAWYIAIDRLSITNKTKMPVENNLLLFIVLLGYFLPWFALDIIFFDQFYYFLVLAIYAKDDLYTGKQLIYT